MNINVDFLIIQAYKLLSLVGLFTVSVCGSIASASTAPDYSAYHAGSYLTYLPNVDETDPSRLAHVPKLRIAFGDSSSGLHSIVMDTGSTGIVVSADRIPHFDQLPVTPGRLTYSSSGRIMIGVWVTVPVTIAGENGASVTTTSIPVLAVTRIECLPDARECEPGDEPRGIAMMGIGFDRESDGQAQSTPRNNPFLNVTSEQPMRHGYIVTRNGVHIGLTSANTQRQFSYVKLAPNPNVEHEWMSASVCMTINHKPPAACGISLVDTGVTAMFLTLPPAMLEGAKTLSSGTTLSLSFPGADNAANAAQYELTVGGEATPLTPTSIHLNTTRPTPFVNTGVHFLNGFDVLYDADGGFIAYRPVE